MGITKPFRTEYIQKFPGEVPPSRFTIHKIVKKFETTAQWSEMLQNLAKILFFSLSFAIFLFYQPIQYCLEVINP